MAVIISNGIKVKNIEGFAGYIKTNDIVSIKRDSFSKLVPYDSMLVWAIKQKSIIDSLNLKDIYSMRYNGLLMTFNLHDEKLPILLKKNNNKYSYISIREFKNDLNKISEFKIHFEGHSVHGRLPNCDGYIDFQHRFSVDEIIKENDMHKLIKYKDLIKSIIKAHWGDFEFSENNLLAKGGYYIDMPYMVIESYKKKALKIE